MRAIQTTRRSLVMGAGALAAGMGHAAAQRLEPVDVLLALAADGSGSIDDDELRLQREGYAEALAAPDFLKIVSEGAHGRIAVAYIEWGGPASQHVIVDWQAIHDAASARDFGEKLIIRPRAARGFNSISAAIDFSVAQMARAPYRPLRRVIDVSGDGPHIGGRPVEEARDEAVAMGIVINALAILRPGGAVRGPGGRSLPDHYRDAVIGGPGAFVEIADENRSFADAVRRKLRVEIA